jgi:hypothetical protein
MTKKTAAAVTVAVLAGIAAPATAQFGFSIVSDPGAYTRMATELQQAIREYEAIMSLYQMSQAAYANMERAARNITTKNVWMPARSAWTYPTASNTYGTTAEWMRAANTGVGQQAAYRSATIPLQNYAAIWATLTSAQQDQLGRAYGSVEISDAAAMNALRQVGVIRSNSEATNAAIGRLAADASSNSPELNTEVGVLNQVSAAGVIAARQQENTNQLLTALVDQQVAQSKLQRDAIATAISADVAARQNAGQNTTAIWGGTTAARLVRLP